MHFHYNLGLDCDLDYLVYGLDSIHETYKSYKLELTNSLAPLTILSHNHQNYNYDIIGPCFSQVGLRLLAAKQYDP
jgi:hypothetical protein